MSKLRAHDDRPAQTRPGAGRRPTGLLLELILACTLLMVWTGPAQALQLDRLYAGPIDAGSACNPEGAGATPATQAAGVEDFCFAFRTQRTAPTGDHLRSTVIEAPQGVVANADSAPQCTTAAFAASDGSAARCAANTQVGEATSDIRASIAGAFEIPLAVRGKVFNLTHTTDDAGLLGIQLDPELLGIGLPKQKVLVRFTLRPAPDVGLRAIANGFPTKADTGLLGLQPIAVDTFSFRFWGSKLDHPSMPVSFTRLGSTCKTARTTIAGTSYAGNNSTLERTYDPTGCDRLTIAHDVEVMASERRPDVPTETVVRVLPRPAAEPDVLETANPATAVVTLPPGLMIGAQVASGAEGLPLCSAEAFALTSNVRPQCPTGSAVGTVRFRSPNLALPVAGTVYLGPQSGRSRLPSLMLVADQGSGAEDALRIKLVGELTVDGDRLVATLRDLPDVPFSLFELRFRGGDHATLRTPRSCGTFTGESRLVPAEASVRSDPAPISLTIDEDCDRPAFTASLGVALASSAAGADGAPTFAIDRLDRTDRLTRAVVHLPPGLLASIKGIPECSAADRAAERCPAASRVGTVTASSGVGPAPTTAPPGAIYLTERPTGTVAAVALVVPVRIGDIDLGNVTAIGVITLRPVDLGLDLSVDIPALVHDVPIDLRRIEVALDRPGFSRNPTQCEPLSVIADLTSDSGPAVRAAAPVQATGCNGLGFTPSVAADLPAATKIGDSAGLVVRVGIPGGQSALRRMTVTLPPGIGADLSRVARACTLEEFLASGCTGAAVIGTVAGQVGILDEPVTGRVVLVRDPTRALPRIGLDLRGRFEARLLGATTITKTGQIAVDLDGLPDAPIDDLRLTFEPGARSVLRVSNGFCPTGTARFSYVATGQNGAVAKRDINAPCIATAAKRKPATATLTVAHRASGRPAMRLTVRVPRPTAGQSPVGSRLVSIRLGLPTTATVRPGGKRYTFVRGGRALSARGRTIRVALRGAGNASTTTVELRRGTVGLDRRITRSRAAIPLRLVLRYADGVTERLTVRGR